MDQNTLRQLGFFTVPNSQTGNPVDQTFNFADGQSDPSSSLWDTNPATRNSSSLNQSASGRSSAAGQNRQILPTRPPKTRDGHERKRSKLSTEATPFDSVDYWMQFDDAEAFADIPESMATPVQGHRSKNRQPPEQRSINPARTLNTPMPSLQPIAAQVEDFGNDSPLDNALSDDEDFSGINLTDEMSRIETMPQADIPNREGLYSTPLSWERPQPGLRMDQLIGLTPPSLNEAEQRRLIAIAMNPGPSMGGLGSNLMFGMNSGFGTPMGGSGYGTPTMSQATDYPPHPKPAPSFQGQEGQPKRQNSSISEKGKANAKGGERAAHNDIERKYRTNLKDRIADLKRAVPALSTISEDAGDEDEPSQPGRAPKVSKGTVLTKATEYIQHLERKNQQIMTEHQTLSRRLQAFEQLLAAQATPTFRVPDYSRTLFDPRAFC